MSVKLSFHSALKTVDGIGSVYKRKLENLGIYSVRDLLLYFPFRYEDLSNQQRIIDLTPGTIVTVVAFVWQTTKIRTRSGKTLIKAVINDSTGSLECVWFNQDYLLTVLKPNQRISFSGKVDYFGNKLTLVNPKFEVIKEGSEFVHTNRLVPIYSETAGLKTRWLRSKIFQILNDISEDLKETLPSQILNSYNFLSLAEALKQIHFPTEDTLLTKARERFAFEELFYLNLRSLRSQREEKGTSQIFKTDPNFLAKFEKLLSFKLTPSQTKAISEIIEDLSDPKPMNRLLQGEVGSGKTVVAAGALFAVTENNFQAAFMAPTEILARQHYQTLKQIFGPLRKIALVSSSSKLNDKDFDILVGTHSILQESQNFRDLGLVVVDEQQRFGVSQRKILREKGKQVHYLTMTATPIPRTLALAINGQLKVSILTDLPFGEKKVKTYLVPNFKRAKAYGFINERVKKGAQVFLICPLINTTDSLLSVKSATEEYEKLRKEIFPELKIGLLHGKMSSKEKETTIRKFKEGVLDILVSTPVVEVGIDIPRASIIVIEAAERFGLSSLHQLRGRVGRSGQESFCLLFSEGTSERTLTRLKLLENHNNGYELAELDLKLRGPGDMFGTLQHGKLDLKTADFFNLDLLQKARKEAETVLEKGVAEPLWKEQEFWFPGFSITSKD